jgi:hypothetical protein
MPFIKLPSIDHARYAEHDDEGRAPIEAQDVVLIHHIAALLKEAEASYAKLSLNARNAMMDFHTENHHVPHCVTHGAQNAQEVVDDIDMEN